MNACDLVICINQVPFLVVYIIYFVVYSVYILAEGNKAILFYQR